ncbi:hypothetical protein BUALT_Bualt05G0024500 [Buddleja alternifolia]|uniref:Uncharacterized protein n=1 Tax=Buddleja alternifolia TaxID=168488 RepID=A0AAV6XG28_9LAMI|nr:hypothetical protein BUALT_Bualt05G0024500 [Buddleja alternifolia]
MLSTTLNPTFVLGVVLVYGLSQGFSGAFFKVVSDYYWKDVQKVQPSEVQLFIGLYYIPWVMKPIWGLLTDVFPVKGYRRRPYFVLAGIVGVVSAVSVAVGGRLAVVAALSCLIGITAAVAIADVTIDACIARNSIEIRSLASDMQSLCGFCSSFGALLGYSTSGFFVHHLGAQVALGLLAIPPATLILLGFVIYEPRNTDDIHVETKKPREKLREAVNGMYKTIQFPQVWKPSLYMYLSLALSISTHEGQFYWYTDPKAGPAFSQVCQRVFYAYLLNYFKCFVHDSYLIITEKFMKIMADLNSVRDRLVALEARVQRTEALLGQPLETPMVAIFQKFQDLEERVEKWGKSMDEIPSFIEGRMVSLAEDISILTDAVDMKLDAVNVEISVLKRATGSVVSGDGGPSSKLRVPDPKSFGGERSAKELENFLWDMETYFQVARVSDAEKVSMARMLDLIFILRWNLALGIPDYFFVVLEECVSRIISRIRWMPMMVLSSQLCPLGIEGTFFALLMCIDSLGALTSKWGGGMILHLLHVTRTDFKNLWLTVLIRNILRISTLALIFLVPNATPSEVLIPPDVLIKPNGEDVDDDSLQLVPLNEKMEV